MGNKSIQQKNHKDISQKQLENKKATSAKKQFDWEDEDEDIDEECFYYEEAFPNSKYNEGWIRCGSCKTWAHEACAGCNEEEDQFECEFCI